MPAPGRRSYNQVAKLSKRVDNLVYLADAVISSRGLAYPRCEIGVGSWMLCPQFAAVFASLTTW